MPGLNKVIVTDNKLYIDGVEVKGLLNRNISQTPGKSEVTITFIADVKYS